MFSNYLDMLVFELVTNVKLVCFLTFIAQVTTDNVVMWVIQLNTADWVYSKTPILLETSEILNPPREESHVSLEVEHLFP